MMVKKWVRELKRRQQSIEDDPSCVRSMEATIIENRITVKHLVMNDRRLKVDWIAQVLDISDGIVDPAGKVWSD